MTDYVLPRLDLRIYPLSVAAGWMAFALASSLGQGNAPYVPTMTFDVASVRESQVDAQKGFTVGGGFTPHTTMLRGSNLDIGNLLVMAYDLQHYQLDGVPQQFRGVYFNVSAKADSDADARLATLSNEQQRLEQQHMLQVLLADRFKLRVHWETKERDVYNLMVAKGGPKLGAENSKPPTADELKWLGDHLVPPLYQRNDGKGYDFFGHGCRMEQLVPILAGQFGRPVIDKTGLTGKYDFVLKYSGRWDSDRAADDMDPLLPMDQAIQQELGLKVEAAKGPVQVLVIDHLEKPSEN
jgi:uncharacterized protein (TIGR03435 family)